MRRVLLTAGLLASLVSSAIAFSEEKNQNIGINIAPVVCNFKGNIGTGVEFGVGYKNYTISYIKLNGDFEKKEITINTPYNIFIKNLSVKTNSVNRTDNFIGISYIEYINNQADDIDIRKNKNLELSYLIFKGGVSVNNNNPYYIGLSYNYIKKIYNKLYCYSEAGIDKYKFGTETSFKIGISYNF